MSPRHSRVVNSTTDVNASKVVSRALAGPRPGTSACLVGAIPLPKPYRTLMPAPWVKNLTQFANIRVGGIVVMPADRERADVHFGMVVPNRQNPSATVGSAPYRRAEPGRVPR